MLLGCDRFPIFPRSKRNQLSVKKLGHIYLFFLQFLFFYFCGWLKQASYYYSVSYVLLFSRVEIYLINLVVTCCVYEMSCRNQLSVKLRHIHLSLLYFLPFLFFYFCGWLKLTSYSVSYKLLLSKVEIYLINLVVTCCVYELLPQLWHIHLSLLNFLPFLFFYLCDWPKLTSYCIAYKLLLTKVEIYLISLVVTCCVYKMSCSGLIIKLSYLDMFSYKQKKKKKLFMYFMYRDYKIAVCYVTASYVLVNITDVLNACLSVARAIMVVLVVSYFSKCVLGIAFIIDDTCSFIFTAKGIVDVIFYFVCSRYAVLLCGVCSGHLHDACSVQNPNIFCCGNNG